jgi:hypothetical protein
MGFNSAFKENPFRGSRAVPRGRADMAKLTVAFRKIYKRHLPISNASEFSSASSTRVQ